MCTHALPLPHITKPPRTFSVNFTKTVSLLKKKPNSFMIQKLRLSSQTATLRAPARVARHRAPTEINAKNAVPPCPPMNSLTLILPLAAANPKKEKQNTGTSRSINTSPGSANGYWKGIRNGNRMFTGNANHGWTAGCCPAQLAGT